MAAPNRKPHTVSRKPSTLNQVGRKFSLPTAAENLDTLLRGLVLDAPHGFMLGEGIRHTLNPKS